ncbi:FxsC protein [Sphaerisporangium corydalis]|uniref:FxsC protein n=1 Tax=Sphaerisporangium corydalis TaxID=1441875 RepID=A0ABV9EBA8_9ACTN|nr:FxsC protein [Sphaerisporangium corydalis]
MRTPADPPPAGRPYFFLSYEPTPRFGPDDMSDPDRWVAAFFERLSAVVSESADLPLDAEAGYMDRERSRNGWSARTALALRTCRVFVPLYASRYFASERCGREWAVFNRRVERSVGEFEPTEAIIPALWVPTPLSKFPAATEPVKFDASALGDAYQRLGFYGIMRTGLQIDYELSVHSLAERIVRAAESAQVLPGTEAAYQSARNAFVGYPYRKLQIILAPARLDSTSRRDAAYYGDQDAEWNPYYPGETPLAEYATDLARNLEYTPEVVTLRENADQVLSATSPAEPGVLVLDPWAARDPELLDRLRRFDRLEKPWIDVIIPWNQQDRQTIDAEAELEEKLESALPRRLLEGRMTSRISARDTSTIEEFGRTLRAVVHRVGNQYLKYGTAHPPAGRQDKRLRLRGPGETEDRSKS